MYLPSVHLPPLGIEGSFGLGNTLPPILYTPASSSSSYSLYSHGSSSCSGVGMPSFASQPAILREQAQGIVDRIVYLLDDYEGLSGDWDVAQQAIVKEDLKLCYFRLTPGQTFASWKMALAREMVAVNARISSEYRSLLSVEYEINRCLYESSAPVELYLDAKKYVSQLKTALRSCHSYPAPL